MMLVVLIPERFNDLTFQRFNSSPILLLQLLHADRPLEPGTDWLTFDSVAGGLDWSGNILPAKECVDAARGPFALGDGVDYFAPAVGAIAACEDMGKGGLT